MCPEYITIALNSGVSLLQCHYVSVCYRHAAVGTVAFKLTFVICDNFYCLIS